VIREQEGGEEVHEVHEARETQQFSRETREREGGRDVTQQETQNRIL